MSNQVTKSGVLVAIMTALAIVAGPASAQDGSAVAEVFATIGLAVAAAGVAYIAAIGSYVVFPWLGRMLKKT